MRFELPRARGKTCSLFAVANRFCVVLPKQVKRASHGRENALEGIWPCIWERVQFFICLAFPVVPFVLCCDATLQVVQNVLLCFHFVFLLLFSLCALSHSASASFSFFSASSSVLYSWLNCSGSLHFWNQKYTYQLLNNLWSLVHRTHFPAVKPWLTPNFQRLSLLSSTTWCFKQKQQSLFIFYYLPDFCKVQWFI